MQRCTAPESARALTSNLCSSGREGWRAGRCSELSPSGQVKRVLAAGMPAMAAFSSRHSPVFLRRRDHISDSPGLAFGCFELVPVLDKIALSLLLGSSSFRSCSPSCLLSHQLVFFPHLQNSLLDRVLLHACIDRWMPTCCSMAAATAAAMQGIPACCGRLHGDN
jgi:hypothetical protein